MKQTHHALPDAIAAISQLIASEGGKALLVGGCVRDTLLGFPPKDFDIEVYGLSLEELLALLSGRYQVSLVGGSFGVIKVHGLPVDISIPRHTSIDGKRGCRAGQAAGAEMTPREAASRRDFTINAMAMDPLTGEVLDYFGGLQDLEHRILRHTSEKFGEDPLRVLRGLQLIGRFELTPAPETIALARDLFKEYYTIAIERIWGEWSKWAAGSVRPSLGLHWLRDTQWLQAYPELGALQECPQSPQWHPEGDVWTHTLLVIDEAARIADRDGLSSEPRIILVLAALCHDLGKPSTTEVTPNGIHSRGHAQAQDIYQQFLQRIGAPKRYMSRIMTLCLHHLTHLGFSGSFRHVRRLARALSSAGESIDMLGRLVEADTSGRFPLPKQMPPNMQRIVTLAKELDLNHHAPPPILLGRHLIELGWTPGPHLGLILKAAYEAQLDGTFSTLEGAKQWALTKTSSPTLNKPHS